MFSPLPSPPPSPFNVGFNAETSRFIKFYGKRQQHWGQGDGNVSNVERNTAICPNSFESDCSCFVKLHKRFWEHQLLIVLSTWGCLSEGEPARVSGLHSQKHHKLVTSCQFYRLQQTYQCHQVAISMLGLFYTSHFSRVEYSSNNR